MDRRACILPWCGTLLARAYYSQILPDLEDKMKLVNVFDIIACCVAIVFIIAALFTRCGNK